MLLSFRSFLVVFLVSLSSVVVAQAPINSFVGDYSGSADIQTADGSVLTRDMSVSIRELKEGFSVRWSSTTYREGEPREKSYQISFVPSDRPGVFAAAMTKNVFGHEVPLDPMKGEPYVWARIGGDTLTVFSLFVDNDGGYEIQQFDRTLAEGGLELEFRRLRNGEPQRSVSTFLKQD